MAIKIGHIEGYLTKNIREGTAKSGNAWMQRSISVYDGKDKEGNGKTTFINFFVKPQDQDTFREMQAGTKLRLSDKLEIEPYKDKNDVTKISINLVPAWDDWYEIIAEAEDKTSQYSDEPF